MAIRYSTTETTDRRSFGLIWTSWWILSTPGVSFFKEKLILYDFKSGKVWSNIFKEDENNMVTPDESLANQNQLPK